MNPRAERPVWPDEAEASAANGTMGQGHGGLCRSRRLTITISTWEQTMRFWPARRRNQLIATLMLAVGGAVAALLIWPPEIFPRVNHATTDARNFGRTYPPAMLRGDLDTMFAVMRRVHPNFAAVTRGAELDSALDAVKRSIQQPMTRLEFYGLAATLNAQFADGHSYLLPPAEEWQHYLDQGGLVFPLGVRFEPAGAVVAAGSGDSTIAPGTLLVAINGVAMPTIARQLLSQTSGERLEMRTAYAAAYLQRALAMDYHMVDHMVDSFTVQWMPSPGASPRTTRLGGVAWSAFDRRMAAQESGRPRVVYAPIAGEPVAVLTVRNFDAPVNEFGAELRRTFALVRRDSIRHLIIDLRQNNGGDSRNGDALQSYVEDSLYPAFAVVETKITPETKALYRSLLPPALHWVPLRWFVPMLRDIDQAPEGQLLAQHPDEDHPRPRREANALQYRGALSILIGPRTYSSAVIFAAPFKHYHLATMIGEETGEPLVFYGDDYDFDLPATHLQAQISHKRFTLLGGRDDGRGIMPDTLVRPASEGEAAGRDAVLDAAVSLARAGLSRRP